MNYLINFLKNNYLITFAISPLIILILTFHNPYYSDDYQTIIGLKLFNLINSQLYFSIFDIFELRSDGHFAPILYFTNQFFPDNFYIIHSLIILSFYLSIIVFYKILLDLKFPKNNSILACFIYSSFFIFTIKPLVWNVFHSHITNSLTGLLSIYLFLQFIKNKNIFFLFLYLFFGLITVLNSETGLIYPLICFFLIFLFIKPNRFIDYLFILIPIILYFSLTYYLSSKSNVETIFESRALFNIRNFFEFPNFENGLKSFLLEYRSRTSPNNFFGYVIILSDNILNFLNLSTYEYIYRALKLSSLKILVVVIFFINSISLLIILIKFFLRKNIFVDKIFLKYFFVFILALIIYSFIFHRKDICIVLALFSSIIYVYIFEYIKIYYSKTKAILFLLLVLSPSLMYAVTGFEEVYEMRSRSYINQMHYNHVSQLDKNKINKEMTYYKDFMSLYCYRNFEKYKKNLNSFKKYNMFEFEINFSKYVDTDKNICSLNKDIE